MITIFLEKFNLASYCNSAGLGRPWREAEEGGEGGDQGGDQDGAVRGKRWRYWDKGIGTAAAATDMIFFGLNKNLFKYLII